jgi:hypothetical protein
MEEGEIKGYSIQRIIRDTVSPYYVFEHIRKRCQYLWVGWPCIRVHSMESRKAAVF